ILQIHLRHFVAGTRAGDEVAQVYLQYPDRPQSPLRSLVGFQRVHLKPGEQRTLPGAIHIAQRARIQGEAQRALLAGL
ncbi:fibronectin type III-like domain-contianing protein, partial [Xanthomonas arboricola]|uniref:fibronectin type III-like domain-contianing protein n=1 Tax=Xanthomonas arboricola TaxID=56448 RepID=UPI00215891DB